MTETRHEVSDTVIALPAIRTAWTHIADRRDLLIKVRDLISDPQHHCTNTFAVDVANNSIEPEHHTAFAWCLLGAVRKIAFDVGASADLELQDEFIMALRFDDADEVANFNDTNGHDYVIDRLDRNIVRLDNAVRFYMS